MEKRSFKIPVWLIYSVAFAVVITATFGLLRFEGLTNIWRVDGIAQHFPILKEFYGILHGTVHQSLFSWSWNLGLGADQMTSFAYYVVGDPFAYLIALFPADKIELGYQLLTIVRLYAVGLSFLALARQLRFKRAGSLLGALIYTFNGFTFYVSFHHPFFLLAPFFFPLLCLGVDKIYQGEVISLADWLYSTRFDLQYLFLVLVGIRRTGLCDSPLCRFKTTWRTCPVISQITWIFCGNRCLSVSCGERDPVADVTGDDVIVSDGQRDLCERVEFISTGLLSQPAQRAI
ncbi:glycosyltransferase [Secundilactobacillus paracollinoides DSM 15502 = JCM 11969]|nr:glycosyltransferase [Secundilactobacillus paracollinoides DSM 15502 = JCM 11969]